MKLLHTSDWHLGDRLGNVDRTADQLRALDHLLRYCDDYRVDALVVAGDIFDDYQGATLAGLVRELARRLQPHLRRGMHALFISGNHDREYLFQLVETVQLISGEETARQVHFASRARILTLPDPSERFIVQFVLAPYPTTYRYLPDDVGVRGLMLAERNQALARAFATRLAAAHNEINPREPAVLVSHVYVRTAETPTLFRMSESEDIPIEPQDLPVWAYVALGHIHKPQAVGGRSSVRYSGSPERLDAGESDDEKSCVLIEINRAGLTGDPVLLSLPATPIYTIGIEGADGIDALAQRYPDHQQALVHLRVAWRPGDNLQAMLSQLRATFPRCYRLEPRPLAEPSVARRVDADPRDVASTVREFLEQRLEGHPGREQLLQLAGELVEEVRDAAAAG